MGSLRAGRLDEAYQAEDTADGSRVALRVMRRASGMIAPSRALVRTCRKLKALRHPNVARVIDIPVHVDRDDPVVESSLLVVSELVEGDPLGSFVRKERPLDRELARELIAGICAGLETMHRRGVVHGNLSSAAVLLTKGEDGSLRPVITDFGLAETGTASLGSPVYRAPETIVGRVPDRMSDVFSLGVILYEILSGRIPFTGGNLLALDFRSLEEEPRPLHELIDDLDPVLDDVVSRCLSRAPEDRYAHAGEVRSAIRGIDTPTPRTRRNVSTLGAAALLVAVMFGGSALLDRLSEAERRREAINVPVYRPSFAILDIAPLAGADPWIATGLSELIRDEFSNDGALRVASPALVREYAGATSLAGTPDTELGSLVRSLFDVEAIVIGSITTGQSADVTSVALDLCVIDARSGETIAAAFERGSPDSLPELAARAAGRLRTTIGLPEGDHGSSAWDPDAVRPWATGLLLLEEHRVRDALTSLEEAAAIQPANARIQDAIAAAWTRIGSARRAADAAGRAIDLSRDAPLERASERRATLALLEGDGATALDELHRLARAFPDRVSHSYRLVDTLLQAGATRQAADEINRIRASRATLDPRTEIMDARLQSRVGRLDNAVVHCERAIALARVSGSEALESEAMIELAIVQSQEGDRQAALATLDGAEAVLDGPGRVSGLTRIETIRADLLKRGGNLDGALTIHQRLCAWYESTGQEQGLASCLGARAAILSLGGRHSEARELLNDAIARFAGLGDEAGLVRSLGAAGTVNHSLGRLDEARFRLGGAVELSSRNGLRTWEGFAHLGLARVAVEALDLDAADQQVNQALEGFGNLPSGASTVGVEFVRADLDRIRGRLRDAENRLAGIATTGRESVGTEIQAEIHLALAVVTLASGRNEAAGELAMRALDDFSRAGNLDRQADCLTIAYQAATRADDRERRRFLAEKLDTLGPLLESPMRRLRLRLARAVDLEPGPARAERLAVHEGAQALGLELVRLEAAASLRDGASGPRDRERWAAEVDRLVERSGARHFLTVPD